MSDRVVRQLLSDLQYANSYTRLPALLNLVPELPALEWLALVGQHWQTCDNISAHISRLRRCPHFRERPWPIAEMMTDDERATLNALPDRFTVYRGCGPNNIRGWCWTIDEQVAARFPFTNRYKQGSSYADHRHSPEARCARAEFGP